MIATLHLFIRLVADEFIWAMSKTSHLGRQSEGVKLVVVLSIVLYFLLDCGIAGGTATEPSE